MLARIFDHINQFIAHVEVIRRLSHGEIDLTTVIDQSSLPNLAVDSCPVGFCPSGILVQWAFDRSSIDKCLYSGPILPFYIQLFWNVLCIRF